jgi:FkbM family methyltransferase
MRIPEFLKAAARPMREFALRLLLGGRGMRRIVNGIVLRVDPRSRHSFATSYDAEAAEYLRGHLRPGAEVWNVGANVGVWVLQMASWMNGTGRIVAFEPNPEAREVLRANLRLNGLSHVEIIEAAVGERVTRVPFFTSGSDGMARAGRPNPLLARTRCLEAQVTTLDLVAGERGAIPDWIIMDIEGWEIAALRGGSRLLENVKVIVELHPTAWEWSGHTRSDLEALIAAYGLEVIPLAGQRDALSEHGQVLLRQRADDRASESRPAF